MKKMLAAALGLMLVVLGGCATVSDDPSLFGRLGGRPALTSIVNEFFANLAADDRIKTRLAKTDSARLKDLWVDRLCVVSGGPCTSDSKSFQSAYSGTRLTYGEFNVMMEDLSKALVKYNVSPAQQNELLPLVFPSNVDIIDQ